MYLLVDGTCSCRGRGKGSIEMGDELDFAGCGRKKTGRSKIEN